MTHPNAALTPKHRRIVARLVVDDGWPISEVAARLQVSWPTVKRWAERYRSGEPMSDRSSRPRTSPAKTSTATTKRCISLRLRLREGPVQPAPRLGIAPSTVHRILVKARLNRLSHVDRATGEPIRQYEHPHAGSLVHVDVKKIGNIPDGGGWRYVGRRQGERNRAATPDKPRNQWHGPKMGYAYIHTVLDDYSRIAYTEVHDDETAVGVLHRAVEWFAKRGVTIERVLSDRSAAASVGPGLVRPHRTIKERARPHSFPLSTYSALVGLRQDPGSAAESPTEARTWGNGSREVRVLLSTYGSRGDVEPLVGLAVQLRALGAEVRMCAPPDKEFAQRLASIGVPMVPFGQTAQPQDP